jgi:hypothetical protein
MLAGPMLRHSRREKAFSSSETGLCGEAEGDGEGVADGDNSCALIAQTVAAKSETNRATRAHARDSLCDMETPEKICSGESLTLSEA